MTSTAIILAAGQGKRMGSDLAKVLHQLDGKALVSHVIDACNEAGIEQKVVIVGHQREAVKTEVEPQGCDTAVQGEQLGTGHAVMMAKEATSGDVSVVLCGDAPLVPGDLLKELLEKHRSEGNACTGVAARMADPTGYGRMVLNEAGALTAIVEQRDASPEELKIDLINSGIFAFDSATLFDCLEQLRPDNSQGEYYLTDVVKMLASSGKGVGLVTTDDPDAVLGINTPEHLAQAEAIWAKRKG